MQHFIVREEFISLGYTIASVALDGKRGLHKASEDIPIQNVSPLSKVAYSNCLGKLSLKKKIIQRYLTMRPKFEASKALKKIVSRLAQTV